MKKILTIVLAGILCSVCFFGCGKNTDKTVIELNEVTHSVFYAPLYVAIENGYFDEENLQINLTNGGGANNSITAVISKNAHIGLMGPETVLYVKYQEREDMPKVIGQLTQRDGSFLVSRKAEPDFKWTDLRGKNVLAGRLGGVPAMTFEYMMKELGLINNVDYTLDFSVPFEMMTGSFIGGTGDYCTVFEPTASELQANGTWHIVGSVGAQSGEVPYTSFICLESYISKNKETLKKFMRALKKGFEFINENTTRKVAESIIKQFPSTTINSIETALNSYKTIDAWKTDMQPTKASFDRLQDIMEYSKVLEKRVDFEDIVDNSIAKEIFG